ncbi:helix-turn-helix domain-containing protein [Bombilactobacillus folatiphilus]|uniref:Helix-turn-helix domain-containing protein n=1 Tax=Bombilactobacillus folatiphilus TaxID=2923362 RepID=A0ABY4P8Z0_9LACO|nr:helix-turn-helix domain-containing protein [Bombilactobacillus folatiphilus]UQS82080.1 helix-turn-helix domain-containing protein [Bombilactobacillus folatiphilus]
MKSQIFKQLQKLTSIERLQLIDHHFINDLPHSVVGNADQDHWDDVTLCNDYFFQHNSIYLSKHNRFAPYPKHSHKFLELNYMFDGSCHQKVDEQEVTLHTGDLLLMDIGCNHSIETLGEHDLLINLLFRNQNITFDLLNDIYTKNSLTYNFLSNISLGKINLEKYIIFPKNSDIEVTMNAIINEYYQKENFSNTIMESYLNILFAKIIRHYPLPTQAIHNNQQELVFTCLKQIEKNYQTITLADLATQLGYNKEYLGSLIHKVTNSNFSDLKTQQRLIQANNLLKSSLLPIDKIITQVGINNKNFFYKKYRQFYGISPGQARQRALNC